MIFDLVAVFVVAIFAGGIASFSGFGIGSLLTPLIAYRIDLQTSVAVVSIAHLLGTAYRFVLIRNDLNKDVFVKFGIWSALGGLLGAVIGTVIQDRTLILVFAGVLAFAGFSGLFGIADKMRYPKQLAWFAGFVSGGLGGLVGNQGGIRSAALMGFSLSKNEFVATATAIALLVDCARMPVYFANQYMQLSKLWLLILVATAGVLLGTWLGQHFLREFPEKAFKRAVCGIILALGIAMFFKST